VHLCTAEASTESRIATPGLSLSVTSFHCADGSLGLHPKGIAPPSHRPDLAAWSCARRTRSLLCSLVTRDRAEQPGHHSARRGGQVQFAGLDGLRDDLVPLAQLDVLLKLLRRPVQAIGMPDQDRIDTAHPDRIKSYPGSRLAASPSTRTGRCP